MPHRVTSARPPVLAVGAHGAAVRALKAQLRAGHYLVDAGDRYSTQTRDAVVAFQKVNHLTVDGAAGPQVRRALARPAAPQPGRGSGARNRVVVDRTLQVLEVVRAGKVTAIVDASTGSAALADGKGEVTPTGTFHVQRKVAGVDTSELGTLWWPSYFTGGIAVHGEPVVPHTPGSHGCVRVPMWAAAMLFRQMPVGSTVVVRD